MALSAKVKRLEMCYLIISVFMFLAVCLQSPEIISASKVLLITEISDTAEEGNVYQDW